MADRELEILGELEYYKWGNQFCCVKCGNDKYKKGKKPFSRRCSKCDTEESLLKNTGLEGTHLSIVLINDLLEYFIAHAGFDFSRKFFFVEEADFESEKEFYIRRRKSKDDSDEDEKDNKIAVSGYEFIEVCKKNKIKPSRIDEMLLEVINKKKLTLRKLAKKFDLEENTVIKLLDKINIRIKLEDEWEEENSFDRIMSYICQLRSRCKNVNYFLGMLMVPLVGKWEYGIKKIGIHWYGLMPQSLQPDTKWGIFKIKYTEDDLGDYHYTFDSDDEIEYGSDQWRDLFCKKN